MISIVVPIYNTEKYLKKCIDSILAQTYQDFELILVDDGSTDSSGAICDQYAEKDARIRVIHQKNGGQATARNAALDLAKGEYIGFVDSDDYILPEMYETLLIELELQKADIAICSRYSVNEDESRRSFWGSKEPWVKPSKEVFRKLLVIDEVGSSPCDKLFKASLFEGIRFPAGYICEDVDVLYRLIDRAKIIAHCGKPLYCYLQRPGSTSHSSFSEKTKGLERYHKAVCDYAKQKYPEFSLEADYFYLSRIPALYNLLQKAHHKGPYKKHIGKILRKNFKKIKANPYFSKKEKRIWLLTVLGLFDWIYGIYKNVKKGDR